MQSICLFISYDNDNDNGDEGMKQWACKKKADEKNIKIIKCLND